MDKAATVRALYEAFNRRDFDAAVGLVDPEVTMNFAVVVPDWPGRSAAARRSAPGSTTPRRHGRR
jgi:ketosteroid isomerase-like protein